MDQASVSHEQQGEATPIFGAYRRGYDPEQVDRYVAEQQRRLDETTVRASEAERKLAAAVGQLRELHRRVAVLESEDRSPQPAPLNTLGERVQRILQEAWEGAYALRQATEQEMAELRERTAGEAEATVVAARQRARAIEAEIERRRNAYLEQVEHDRTRAVTQIAQLHRERDDALTELLKVKSVIEATVAEATRRRPHRATQVPDAGGFPAGEVVAEADGPADATLAVEGGAAARELDDETLAATMPVQRLERTTTERQAVPSPSELVRSHRAASGEGVRSPLEAVQPGPAVFDFEEEAGR